MKSLKHYSNEKNNYFTSIQGRIENAPITEAAEYFVVHGANLDSIMHKLGVYNYRLKNPNFIHESEINVNLTLDEQAAARDFFLCVANQFERNLYIEFCNEHNIEIDTNIINEGVKDFLNKIGDAAKNISDKTKEAFDKLKNKISEIKEFVSKVVSGAIKTAKDIYETLTNMFIKFGTGLKGIVEKLISGNKQTINLSDIESDFYQNIKAAYEDEAKNKQHSNIYEALGEAIKQSNYIYEEQIIEGLFSRNKDNDDDKKTSGNEYDDARSNNGKSSSKSGGVWKAIGKALINMAAYYIVTIVIPLIIMIACPVPGTGIAAIIHYVGAGVWGTIGIVKQIKQIRNVIKSGEFKKRNKFHKIVSIIWWIFMLCCQGAAMAKSVKGLADIGKFLVEGGGLQNVLPPEQLQNMLNWVNNLWKEWTGNPNNIPAVDHINSVLEGEKIKEFERAMQEFKNAGGDIKNMAEFNNWDKLEEVLPKDTVNQLKEIAKMPAEDISKLNWRGYQEIMQKAAGTMDTGNQIVVVTDNAKQGIERLNDLNAHGDSLKVAVTHQQYAIDAIRDATNNQQGIAQLLVIDLKPTPENIELVNKTLGNGLYAVLSKPNALVDTIKEIPHMVADFIPFAGIWPSVTKYVKGPFKIRLGSGRTYYYPYVIPGEDYILHIPYNKFIEEYSDKNPKAIAEVKKYVNENLEKANAYKQALEEKKKLSKEEKKDHKALVKYLENAKEGKAEWEVLVFCTNDETANAEAEKSKKREKKDKNANESLINESEAKYPVMFFCPMLLCFGDLARRRKTKPKRSHIYLFKGLLSRIEILPVKDGMSGNDLMKFFLDLAKNALDASFNIVVDKPCKQEGKTWVENDESKEKGKERMDLGGFTNEQITNFMNNPSEIKEFIGGDFATDTISGGKHKYIEKQDHVRKEFINLLTKNDEIKEFVDKEVPSVKKHLYDKNGDLIESEFNKIFKILARVEKSYISSDSEKQGILKRIKKLFSKDDDIADTSSKIKPEELKAFVLKVASVRVNNLKKKYNEDVEVENDMPVNTLIIEANIEVLEELVIE